MRTPIKPVAPDAKTVMKNYKKDKAMKYGQEYIEPTIPQWFSSYPYMIVIMAVLQVMTVIYGGRDFVFFGFDVSAGWLFLMPIMLYTFQIVAECYGWQYSRQMIWLNLITNILFTSIVFVFRFIPESTGIIHNDLQHAYITLMNPKYISGMTMCFAVFVSDLVASALMCWSRFHWNGKYLVIRVLILHVISETIILSTGFIVDPLHGYSLLETWIFARDAFFARTIIMIALLPVVKFVIWFIRHKIEGVIVFDLSVRFNPFKFNINPADSVQFSVQGQHETHAEIVDMKKLAQAYSKLMLEEQHNKQMQEFNNRNHG